MRLMLGLAAALMAPALAMAQPQAEPAAPAPTVDPMRAIAEADIRDALLDPDSARFNWT